MKPGNATQPTVVAKGGRIQTSTDHSVIVLLCE